MDCPAMCTTETVKSKYIQENPINMVVRVLASLQRIASDVNGMSVSIDNVNRMQAHFESVLKAGGRIPGPKVECGELNTKPMVIAENKMSDAGSHTDILGDSDEYMWGSKQHTELAASNLFNSPILQNSGGIDLVESLRMLEKPSQPDAKTVVSCSCSNLVRSRCPPVHGAVSASRYVVGNVRQRKEALAVGQMCIGGPRLRYQNLEEVTSGHPTWSNLEL